MTWWGEGGRGHYEYHSYRVGWKDFDHVVYFIPKMALAGCGSWLTLKMGSTIARPADAFLLLRKPSGQLVSQREWGVPTSRNGTLHFQWLVFPPTYKIICKISSMYVVIEIDVDVAYQKLCILSHTHISNIHTYVFRSYEVLTIQWTLWQFDHLEIIFWLQFSFTLQYMYFQSTIWNPLENKLKTCDFYDSLNF